MKKTETTNVIEIAMAGLRKKDTTLQRLRYLIPQRLEAGKLINFDGNVIGYFDGEDQVLGSQERVDKATKCTDALLTEIFNPVNHLLGSASERKEDGDEENYVELKTPEEVAAEAEAEAEVDEEELPELPESEETLTEALKPQVKALKKQLKKLEKGTKEYKTLKKQIKLLKGE